MKEDNNRSRVAIPLKVSAWLLIALGLAHIPIFLVSGESWEGPLSWRKPILFGISTGLTVWSIAWVLPRLRRKPGDEWIAWMFSIAMVVEVGLITLQTWRGTASHFNHATALDARVDQVMLLMISLATVVIMYLAARSLVYLDAEDDLRLSINSGFAFLVLSCLIGFVISIYGNQQAKIGENPSVYGQAGVTKFPHGVAIHAIQIFPLACWGLARLKIGMPKRKAILWLMIAGMSAMLFFAVVQTLRGKPRFQVSLNSQISEHSADPAFSFISPGSTSAELLLSHG